MHKNATKCNKTQSKWCINKHGASKIIDTFETYQRARRLQEDLGMVTLPDVAERRGDRGGEASEDLVLW
jgi:hypothetical protein